MENLTAWLWPL